MKFALKGDENALIEMFSLFFNENFNLMFYNEHIF